MRAVIGLILALGMLAGCRMPTPVITATESIGSSQGTLIQLTSGWNCHMQRCFILDPVRRTVSLTAAGSQPVQLPSGFEIADGSVSETEFDYLYRIARFGRASG